MIFHRVVVVESPALKWPDAFANLEIFVKYPYLLPCALAASITFTGKCPFSNIGYVILNAVNRLDSVVIPGS